jgi:cellulose synthase/poly-beta-1,6-N-acetylglucosamine synthase-like glycosyltransferase
MEEKDAMKEIKEYPPITIIIPAYNEEKVISMTLKALLEADYPSPKQIIVIDDGSSDRTSIVAREFEKYGVMVYRKPNGGKSSAINCGLLFTKYPIVVTLDADTIIGRDSLKYLVRPLLNPEVAGVASNALVLNKVNLLTKCQALEYIININIIRRAMALLGKVPIIPGVLGAHRKDFLDYLGRYDHDTITEDFDVTIKYLKVGKVVLASHYAKAFTEAPTTLRDFYRQRMRWYRGNIQTVIKHRDVFKTRKYGALYFLVYPFLIINLFINPILSYINWIMAAISIFMGYWQMIVTLISLFIVLQVLFSLLALEYSEEEDNSLLLISPLFVVGYKHLIDFLMIKAGMDIFFKRKVTWTRARRYGIYAKT